MIFADAMDEVKGTIDKLPNHSGVGVTTLTNVLYWVFAAAGLVAIAMIIYGGIQYQTAQGDPGKIKQATNTIVFSVIGLIIVILATAITAFVSNMVGEAAQ